MIDKEDNMFDEERIHSHALARLRERGASLQGLRSLYIFVDEGQSRVPFDQYDPSNVDYYLRNVTHYLLGLGRSLKTGEEIDGPGESNLSWTMEVLDQGVVPPPRRVLRLFPKAIRAAVRQALPPAG